MKKQVRKITQGAMMLAIIGLFLVLNLQSAGLLEAYMIWILPLPIIFYVVQYGFKPGLVVALAALGLTFILSNFITLFYVFTALVIGLVYGYGVYKNRNNGWLLATTTILSAVSLFVEIYLMSAVFGYDLAAETHEIVGYLKTVDGLIVPADIETLVLGIYPIALLLMAFLQSLITHILAIFMLKRLKISTRKMNPIENYRLPVWAGALAFIGLFASFGLQFPALEPYRVQLMMVTTLSSLVLISDAYLFLILYGRLRRLKWLPMVSILSLLFLPMVMFYVFIGLGLMDCFTDLRQRMMQSLRG